MADRNVSDTDVAVSSETLALPSEGQPDELGACSAPASKPVRAEALSAPATSAGWDEDQASRRRVADSRIPRAIRKTLAEAPTVLSWNDGETLDRPSSAYRSAIWEAAVIREDRRPLRWAGLVTVDAVDAAGLDRSVV